MDGPPPTVSVAVGIIIGLLSSVVQSLGLTIQRKSHVLEELLPEQRRRPEHRRPLWLIGFAIFISSNVLGSVFQIAALPVVILAPLGAVSLLWNAVFARLLLGDVFTSIMAIGTALIAIGAVLIAVFGVVPEPNHSLEDLLALLRRGPFVIYFSLLVAAVLGLLVVTHIAERTLPVAVASVPSSPIIQAVDRATERTPLLPTATFDGKAGSASPPPSIASDAALHRKRMLVAISFASLSGILSGMCIIFAKAGVELLLLTIGGNNQFWRWESWVLVSGLVVVALLQLWYLHKSLVLAAPTLVCPLAFCFYNLSSIINSLIYFDQLALLSTSHLLLVVLGIFVLLSGVGALSLREHGIELGTWTEGGEALDAAIVDVDAEDGVPEADVRRTVATSPGIHHRESRSVHFAFPTIHTTGPSEDASTSAAEPRQRRTSSETQPAEHPHGVGAHTRAPSAPHLTLTRRQSGLSVSDMGQPAWGTGLSIGLSPVSPGFALVPRRRVSSVGAKGLGFAGVVRAAMRRVSDGPPRDNAVESVSSGRRRWTWLKAKLGGREGNA
ncbi:hypothetical protein EXIGLDRAFT_779031 [Exidia glandulosa HHB12029]|uniref:DUF803-domain-containing protein n=1 Tax=Exidia glandulosa HHB12029 TaxID=1314781 RepID=A0A165C940_EXIGL|nr:hypothetical protein EXIGLDRAFT_779031 [Exidia glandulosa HHB12029]